MAVKIIMNCPVKSGILYDEDGDIVMTIENYKEEMTKNASTDESEPSREDLR